MGLVGCLFFLLFLYFKFRFLRSGGHFRTLPPTLPPPPLLHKHPKINTKTAISSHLPNPLHGLRFRQLPRVHDPLLAQIDALDARDILGRGAGDTGGDDDGIGLENDAVVDYLVDGERDEVVVFDQSAFVG